MLTKKDRQKLIDALNTNLMLHVIEPEGRKQFAESIGRALDLPFLDHFVAACVAE